MSTVEAEQVDIVTTALGGSTIRVRTYTYPSSTTLEGERLKQYEKLVSECKTNPQKDEEGYTLISRHRGFELLGGAYYAPILTALTKGGFIKWRMPGIRIKIIERKGEKQEC